MAGVEQGPPSTQASRVRAWSERCIATVIGNPRAASQYSFISIPMAHRPESWYNQRSKPVPTTALSLSVKFSRKRPPSMRHGKPSPSLPSRGTRKAGGSACAAPRERRPSATSTSTAMPASESYLNESIERTRARVSERFAAASARGAARRARCTGTGRGRSGAAGRGRRARASRARACARGRRRARRRPAAAGACSPRRRARRRPRARSAAASAAASARSRPARAVR